MLHPYMWRHGYIYFKPSLAGLDQTLHVSSYTEIQEIWVMLFSVHTVSCSADRQQHYGLWITYTNVYNRSYGKSSDIESLHLTSQSELRTGFHGFFE